MKREIKFRAWGGKHFEMCEVLVISFDTKDAYIKYFGEALQDYIKEYVPLEKLKLMQFTGLKDRNGKEIYEGDILQLGECTGVRRIIIWAKDSYATTNIIGERVSIPLPQDWHKMHLIGNIHENPELLEVET